jgi:hypothetical protein
MKQKYQIEKKLEAREQSANQEVQEAENQLEELKKGLKKKGRKLSQLEGEGKKLLQSANKRLKHAKKKLLKWQNFLEKFRDKKSSQKTASTYHALLTENFNGGKAYYRRNQEAHLYSDVDSENEVLAGLGAYVNNHSIYAHNFGIYPSFGWQIGEKVVEEGENYQEKTIERSISKSYRALVDEVLEHKTAAVKRIVGQINKNGTPELQTVILDSNQLTASYPAMIIRLNDEYPQHKGMKRKKILNEYDRAYPEFLTHLLIACINKELYDCHSGVYFERRQSFGFLTPTATDVGPAIRLSLGLVPGGEWENAVIQGIQKFDQLLDNLWITGKLSLSDPNRIGSPYSIFNKGDIRAYGHKLFLKAMLEGGQSLINLMEQLIDYSPQTYRVEHYFEGFVDKLNSVEYQGNGSEAFNVLYRKIARLYLNLLDKDLEEIQQKTVHEKILYLEDLMNQYRDQSVEQIAELSEISVTSESEDASNSIENQSNKYFTPAGMSALFAPLAAYAEIFGKTFYKTETYCYFEVPGWQIKHSNKAKLKYFQKVENVSDAQVVYIDHNPCVNASVAPKNTLDLINQYNNDDEVLVQMLVIDITSSTQSQIQGIIDAWKHTHIPYLVFATSGLKNQQMGLDMAQYGEVRLLVNENNLKQEEKEKKDQFLKALKKQTQASSSIYATKVRRDLRNNFYELEGGNHQVPASSAAEEVAGEYSLSSNIDSYFFKEKHQEMPTNAAEEAEEDGDENSLTSGTVGN